MEGLNKKVLPNDTLIKPNPSGVFESTSIIHLDKHAPSRFGDKGSFHIEKGVSSVEGGLNPYFERYKFTGEIITTELLDRADEKFKELELLYNGRQRVCIRGFIPIESKPFTADKAENHSNNNQESLNSDEVNHYKEYSNNNLDIYNVIRLSLKKGYSVDYYFYSPYLDVYGKPQDGYVMLISKNGINRPKLNNTESQTQVTLDRLVQYTSADAKLKDLSKKLELPIGYRPVNSEGAVHLNKEQVVQLTQSWKAIFNPDYRFDDVWAIVHNPKIPKILILNEKGILVAAAIAELDMYGNFEITEVYSDAKDQEGNSIKGVGKFMIKSLTEEILRRYPENRIYMEANTTSAMPIVGAQIGFKRAFDIETNPQIIIQKRVGNSDKKLENGAIESNVSVAPLENGAYRNFILLQHPTNINTFAPSRI